MLKLIGKTVLKTTFGNEILKFPVSMTGYYTNPLAWHRWEGKGF